MRSNSFRGRGYHGQGFNNGQRFYQINAWRENYQYQNKYRHQRELIFMRFLININCIFYQRSNSASFYRK